MKIFFCVTVIVSFLIFAFAILRFWFGRNFRFKKISDGDNKANLSKALCFSGCLLLSIFFLRFAVGICAEPEKGEPILNGFEQFVESLFRSLRTFGIEEEYPKFISQLKNLIANQFWKCLTVVYASLLEIIAPISGGAIILEILSSVLPKVRLYLSFFGLGKRKYCYFNELNAPSIALAKSIISEGAGAKKAPKPVVIFADAYVDREDEKEYELFLEARQLGAICVRDDLAHIRKPFSWRKHREYYLMDENEFGNLQSLACLVDHRNIQYIKGAFIYLFVQSDAYVQVEKNIQKELGKLFPGEDEKPRIVPVRGFRNLVHNLLQEVPLYEPLIAKEKKDELNVTILGNGLIGTEAFLSVYWLGQMLVSDNCEPKQCEVTVNVVSKDDEETFWSKIDYVNPEIQKTVEKIKADSSDSMKKTCTENAKELCPDCLAQTASQKSNLDDGLLSYNKKGEKNLPYCKVRYVKSDLKIGGFWDAETEEIREILASDYFIVALGSDADNISIAEKIRVYIGKKHIEEHQKKVLNRTVITYAVFDSELAKTLNEEKCFKSVLKNEGDFDIYTYAFGSLEDVYSCKNVYLSKHNIWAAVSGKSSDSNDTHRLDNLVRIGSEPKIYENSNYDYWANLAKALHVKYKVFSLGWIPNSVFCFSEKKESERLQKENQEKCALYLKLAAISALEKTDLLSKAEMAMYQELQQKKHYLAWLEHRRWNAFTRTMGYRQVDIQKMLAGVDAQKDMRLKLHSCLVEAEFPNNPARNNCYMWMEKDCAETEDENLDTLDRVSKEQMCDYKEYDYCAYELGDISSEDDLVKKLTDLRLINTTKESETNSGKNPKKIRVLFVGNSYTFYNEMPQTFFTECAKKAGFEAEVTSVTRGGHRLAQFADPDYVEGKRLRQIIKGIDYDVAILQEQSLTPIKDEDGFLAGVENVAKLIFADRFILYATWGRNDGSPHLDTLGLTRQEMTEKLSTAYNKAAEKIGAHVAEVGKAFLAYAEEHDKNNLYKPDYSHPSAIGSELAAKVIWEQVEQLIK